MLSSNYPGSYYIKLHLNQKCFSGGSAGNNFTPVEPASLQLEMLIENTSVIDGAGNSFSFIKFQNSDTENDSEHVTLTSILRLNDFLKCMTRQCGKRANAVNISENLSKILLLFWERRKTTIT